ncbi:MAG TPA: phosphate ABC transporter permease PstA [Polyangiaceae bacterium]|nr:phosphate ABC transporter permease PstA [Polyangiaceae bacterium]
MTRLFSPRRSQQIARVVLWALMGLAIAVLVAVLAFVLERGLPHLSWSFLSEAPRSSGLRGGVFPILVGTLEVTLLGVAMAAPLGIGTAVYLCEYTREGALTRVIRFGSDCLAGVPSIIFGLFGFVLFVTTLGMGWSILAGSLTLALMILPTVIRTSEEALRAVPAGYREVALSLGATHWQAIAFVVLPAALPGIFTGLILSLGRAVGETAALIFTAGSTLPQTTPRSIFDSTRTLSVHFYQLAREGISNERAYAAAAVLVLTIAVINVGSHLFLQRLVRSHQ